MPERAEHGDESATTTTAATSSSSSAAETPPRGCPLSLVTAQALSAALQSSAPPLLLEACAAAAPAGTAPPDPGCIPGAVLFSLAAIDVDLRDEQLGHPAKISGNYSLKPPAELRCALEAAGVEYARPVVVYTQAARAGGLDLAVAARLAWALSLAGCQHVALLAAGLSAWTAEGYATSGAYAPPVGAADFFGGDDGLPFPLRPEFGAATPEVAAAVARGGGSGGGGGGSGNAYRRVVQLADVRSWREFSGGAHDYPFPMPRGRIPTSLWAHWGPSTYVAGDFFSHDSGVLHPLAGTAALWRDWGLRLGAEHTDTRIVFYCGSGWRSAVAWCLAQLLGHADCASYDGGIVEWAWVDERPLECGAPDAAAAAARALTTTTAPPSCVHSSPCPRPPQSGTAPA